MWMIVSGADSETDAVKIQQSLCQLLSEAGMVLRKWRSSSSYVIAEIPADLKEIDTNHGCNALKALGIHWDTVNDNLFVTTPAISHEASTKRNVAQIVAGVYDVLRLTAPW